MAKFIDGKPFECPALKNLKKKERFKKPTKQKAHEIRCKYNLIFLKLMKYLISRLV